MICTQFAIRIRSTRSWSAWLTDTLSFEVRRSPSTLELISIKADMKMRAMALAAADSSNANPPSLAEGASFSGRREESTPAD